MSITDGNTTGSPWTLDYLQSVQKVTSHIVFTKNRK